MSLRFHLALIILAPVAMLAGLMALKIKVPVPEFGRDYVVRVELGEAAEIGLPDIAGPNDPDAPLVVIDAGHGGRDPGATSGTQERPLVEKDIVLGIALKLREELLELGGIRVALTREDDRFLTLSERPAIAGRMKADLFVSIHADSAGEEGDAAGASVYTLSERATSAAAARFARRENDADRLNGVELAGGDAEVNAILVELSQRRAKEDALELAGLVEREGRARLNFHPQPIRGADLVVLRTPDMPSILFEAGFLTNPDEAERLSSEEGQEAAAESLARAIQVYFVRQASR
ncbi:N-acetylmuramoyl-L-alanine amidase [Altererythrobacter sp. GH1-8]|uniref:N-acetylmuramoyl-L-alanine amidase family protein n=1 Tax=Altererythrobacter sp. GH1-8 TaxID=3349333 RepID=UPI00374CCB76